MKNIIYLLTMVLSITVFPLFSQEVLTTRTNTYLLNYFGEDAYEIAGQVQVDGKDALLVVHYVDKLKEIIDRAIICSFTDGCIRNYLYVNKNSIQDESGTFLLTTKLNAYGWRIRIMDTNKAKIGFVFYSNNGSNVTDGPRIIWNQEINGFELFKIDTSQY